MKYNGPVKEQGFLSKNSNKSYLTIQFNGINGNDVVDFIGRYEGLAYSRGTWVSSYLNGQPEEVFIRKYDFVTLSLDGLTPVLEVLTLEEFLDKFNIYSWHVVYKPNIYRATK